MVKTKKDKKAENNEYSTKQYKPEIKRLSRKNKNTARM